MRGFVHERSLLALSLAVALAPVALRAQDTTSRSSTPSGEATVSTEVKSARVVYVSGNDLVVKTDDGQVKHFDVPDSTTVDVGGKQLTVHQLKPGMILTRTITTTETPKTVQTVRTVQGKVFYVQPPDILILSFPDGTNKQYKVPAGQKFKINGKDYDIFHLRKGLVISATGVTDSTEVSQTSATNVTGTLPPPPATPPALTVLLIEEPTTVTVPPSAPVAAGAATPAPQVAQTQLPKTGSYVPLIGLFSILFLGAGIGLHLLPR